MNNSNELLWRDQNLFIVYYDGRNYGLTDVDGKYQWDFKFGTQFAEVLLGICSRFEYGRVDVCQTR